MDILGWIGWLLWTLLGLAWSVLWFLVGGWVSTLAQIAVVALVIFGYKYGWRRAPQEIATRAVTFGRFAWAWIRSRELPASASRAEVREVYLPLCRPILASAGLISAMRVWNEFIFALILAQDVDSMTVTYVIAQIFGVILYGPQNYGTLFAAGIIAIIPPVFLAFVFQRFLVQGLTAGSVKG